MTPELVVHAAESLDLARGAPARARSLSWMQPRASLFAAASLALASSASAVAATAYLYQRFAAAIERPVSAASPSFSIVVGTYPPGADDARAMFEWLETSGYRASRAEVDLGSRGRWQRVLAGTYIDVDRARREAERLNAAVPGLDRRVVILPGTEP